MKLKLEQPMLINTCGLFQKTFDPYPYKSSKCSVRMR